MRHLWVLFICGVCMLGVVVPVGAQGNLEIPASGSLQSGIGFIAGWRCKAGTLTYTIDNGPAAPLSYGISRGDTQNSCGGDINNGFIAEENWYLAATGNTRSGCLTMACSLPRPPSPSRP